MFQRQEEFIFSIAPPCHHTSILAARLIGNPSQLPNHEMEWTCTFTKQQRSGERSFESAGWAVTGHVCAEM
jgi:hypothetical protein